MKYYNKVLILGILGIIVGLYFFISAINVKPKYKVISSTIRSNLISPHPNPKYSYSVYGTGTVSTNKKYKVESGDIIISIYDINDVKIDSKTIKYFDGSPINYSFDVHNNEPVRVEYEVKNAKISNKLDIYISLILFSFSAAIIFANVMEKKYSIKKV